MAKKQAKRTRWVLGDNFHGWAWKCSICGRITCIVKLDNTNVVAGCVYPACDSDMGKPRGRIVRVKLVEADGK